MSTTPSSVGVCHKNKRGCACLPAVEFEQAPVQDGISQRAVRGVYGECGGLLKGERNAARGGHDDYIRLQEAAFCDYGCCMAEAQFCQRCAGLLLCLQNSHNRNSTDAHQYPDCSHQSYKERSRLQIDAVGRMPQKVMDATIL